MVNTTMAVTIVFHVVTTAINAKTSLVNAMIVVRECLTSLPPLKIVLLNVPIQSGLKKLQWLV